MDEPCPSCMDLMSANEEIEIHMSEQVRLANRSHAILREELDEQTRARWDAEEQADKCQRKNKELYSEQRAREFGWSS